MSRIALVSSSFAPYRGGVEEHVRHTAAALLDRGHEVLVWTVDRGEHLGVRTVDGVTVRYLPTPLPAARVGALARFARVAPAAWRAWGAALRTDRPDLLHVHCFGPNGVYAAALARRHTLPLVVTGHGETFMDAQVFTDSALLRAALRAALRKAAAVTGVSEVVLADLRQRFGLGHATVIGNGVPPVSVTVPDAAPDAAPDAGTRRPRPDPTICAVGRLEPVKGFDLLLDALPLVMAAQPGTRLRLGGSGSAIDSLTEQIHRLGVAEAVSLLGPLTQERVATEMAAADVVVVPSRREAFGIVVLEAWRSGTALVATNRDGPGTLVRHGIDGLLVDPDDTAALAAAILRVLSDEEYAARLGAAGRDRVAEFTWPAVAAAYERLYAAILRSAD